MRNYERVSYKSSIEINLEHDDIMQLLFYTQIKKVQRVHSFVKCMYDLCFAQLYELTTSGHQGHRASFHGCVWDGDDRARRYGWDGELDELAVG